mmetsp:Transcript_29336/g.57071  ORF Transcript_29336/g.57071 Transcript_29336/m.57071 type:complete len:420 (-) Transcript_29336:2548-3807(-)
MVVRGRNRLGDLGIPHHDIGIRPFDDGPLLGIDVQDLCHVRRRRRDKFIWCQAARLNPFSPEDSQPLLKPVRPVGNDPKIVPACALLIRVEGGVIRGHDLQRPRLQPRPERILVVLGSEGGRHDPARGIVPVGVEIDALVECEELDQRLTIDAHPLLPRPPDRLVRLFAGHMHDVQRHARRIRDGDGPIGRLALKLRWAAIGMTLWPRDPLIEIFLLHLGDQIAVLGMHHRQRAQFGTAFERGEHLIILDHQRALVGHEMLEGIDAHIDGVFHLVKDIFVPAGDRHVIADVGANLRRGFAVPFIDRVLDRTILAGQAEIHDHRGATDRRGPSAGFKRLGRRGPHKGHLKVGVRVNAAGDDISPFGIDVFVAGQILADGLDHFALDQHIRFPGPVRRADHSAFDHFAHVISPQFGVARQN